MDQIIIPDNHYFMLVSQSVTEICAPLFLTTKIRNFAFTRFYDNGDFYILASDNRWIPHYFKKQYSFSPPIPKEVIAHQFHYIVRKTQEYSQALADSRNLFNCDHLIDFVEFGSNYFDRFVFGTNPYYEGIINFYINHIEQLQKFIQYFREKSRDLVNIANVNKMHLPEIMQPKIKANNIASLLKDNDPLSFLSTKNQLPINGNVKLLTSREREILRYIAMGYTSKMISSG